MNLHNQVFNDQSEEERKALSGSQYNKNVLKFMVKTSPLSTGMMIVILVMFILCEITDLANGKLNLSVINGNTLLKYGANSNQLVNQGQIYRLFTAMFLHSGLIHLFANSTSFFLQLMPVQQKTRNIWLYLAVLFLGGMMGNMLSVDVYNIRGKALLAVGASTSICSVIGFDFAARILRVKDQPLQGRRLLITLGYIFLLSMLPGIDFFGHFGSLFGGFLIGASFLKPSERYLSEKQIKMVKILGIVALTAYVAALTALIIKWQK